MKEAIEREVSEVAKDLGEPWRVGYLYIDGKARVYDRNGFYLFLVAEGRDPRAAAERIVDCVNSCADTRNPVEKLVDSIDPDCHHHRVTQECGECAAGDVKQERVMNPEVVSKALYAYTHCADACTHSNKRMIAALSAVTPLIEARQREKDALEMLADVSRVEIDKHNPGLLEADFADLVLNERRAKYLPEPKVQTPEEIVTSVLKRLGIGYAIWSGLELDQYQQKIAAEIVTKLKEQP